MERARAGDVAQMRLECKRTTTAKLNDYRSADFTSGYRFERSISGNPDIDSQHYQLPQRFSSAGLIPVWKDRTKKAG